MRDCYFGVGGGFVESSHGAVEPVLDRSSVCLRQAGSSGSRDATAWLMIVTASRRAIEPKGDGPPGSGIPASRGGPSLRWSSASATAVSGRPPGWGRSRRSARAAVGMTGWLACPSRPSTS